MVAMLHFLSFARHLKFFDRLTVSLMPRNHWLNPKVFRNGNYTPHSNIINFGICNLRCSRIGLQRAALKVLIIRSASGYEACLCSSQRQVSFCRGLNTCRKMSNYADEKVVGTPQVMSRYILSPEEEELAKLGYKQEFTRDFSWFSTFSFAFSISGLLATVIMPPFSTTYVR